MDWRYQAKARRPKRRSSSPAWESFAAGLILALIFGFIGWRWWISRGHEEPKAAPKPAITNVVAVPKPAPPAPSSPPERTDLRPVQNVLEAQIALARQGISSGSIDGVTGSQTHAAIAAYQRKRGLPPTGILDTNTKAQLLISLPAMTNYTITAEDLGRLLPMPKTWLEKSEQPRLDYENIVDLLAEKSFSHPALIRRLNPDIAWSNVIAGAEVTLPRVEYPPPTAKAAVIKISLRDCVLEVFDSDNHLLVHFPCSIGRVAEKRPVGELHVQNVALAPNYTFDPAVFPESPEAQALDRKLIIPPGPRNPVGVAWIGLDRPGYGIHGTPSPEKVGRTESHGCFRLANWNAAYLTKLVWIGMPVTVEP